MLTKEKLKEVLSEQRDYILKKEKGIERSLLTTIGDKIKLPHINILTGIRRCGKSTLMRQIIDKYFDDKNFYYINFEDERLLNFNAEDFNVIYETLIELYGEHTTFFIDEIQNVVNFQYFIRRFYDNGFKFFITGSNANLLSSEIGTKLTGRHIDTIVKPFSFGEYLKLKNINFNKRDLYDTRQRGKLKRYFSEYLIKGGMPEYARYGEDEILLRIYDDIILKDIAVRYNIENVRQMREVYSFLITNFSQQFSFNSVKKTFNFGSVNTIIKYVHFLESTYLGKAINKYDFSYKKQISNEKKFYVADNGFIPKISTRVTKDKGWLLENLVYNSFDSGSEVFYYNRKNECDFVLITNKKAEAAFQVTWELTDSNLKRETDGLTEAMDYLNLKKGTILTSDQEDVMKISNKKIDIKPVWKWLLQ